VSGPKGGSYRVESAEQIEARQLRDAKARYTRVQSLWESAQLRMAATVAVIGKPVPHQTPVAVRSGAGSTEYDAAAARLEALVEKANNAASTALEEHSEAQFAGQIARIAAATAAAAPPVPVVRREQEADTAPAAAPTVDRKRVADRVQRRLSELAAVEHDQERVRVLVDDIANAGSESRIDLLISELDVLVRNGRDAAAHAAAVLQTRAALQEISVRVSGIVGALADSIRRRVADLLASEVEDVPAELKADVDRAVAAADTQADRQHLVASMHRALEQLGYVLGPEFDTQLAGDQGTAVVAGPTAGYGVKVRLESGVNRFSAQAVKSDAVITSGEQDLEVEREFCDDFHELVTLARADGVELDLDIELQPGEAKVQAVAAEKVAARRSVATSRHRPAERKRDRP